MVRRMTIAEYLGIDENRLSSTSLPIMTLACGCNAFGAWAHARECRLHNADRPELARGDKDTR